MPIRKKGNIKIQTSPNGSGIKRTGYTFYSYDKNSAALFFQFRNQNGETTDIANAKIRLLLIKNDDEEKEFIPSQEDFEIISKPGGKAKFVLPEMLLAYQGKVTGYIYLDFEDGSQTDEGQFTFRIRRSMITHVLPEAGDKYVQDFEDVKERVEQAGDSATKDMQNSVDQVNKDYEAWKSTQEKKQTYFESDTNKTINGINTKVEKAQTKVSDLEKNLDVGQKNYFSVTAWENDASTDVVDNDLPAIKIELEGNTKYTLSTNIPMYDESSGRNSVFFATSDVGRVYSGVHGVAIDKPRTITTNNDGVAIVGIRDKDMISGDRWIMINKGTLAAPWTPAPEDAVLRSEIEQNYSDRNLLKGTSDKWKDFRIGGWNSPLKSDLKLSDLGLLIGDSVAYSVEIDDTLEKSEEIVNLGLFFNDKNRNNIKQVYSNSDNKFKNDKRRIKIVTTIPEKAESIVLTMNRDTDEGTRIFKYRKAKLQRGKYATDWNPNPSEIVTQDQYNKLVNAITNLGGSI